MMSELLRGEELVRCLRYWYGSVPVLYVQQVRVWVCRVSDIIFYEGRSEQIFLLSPTIDHCATIPVRTSETCRTVEQCHLQETDRKSYLHASKVLRETPKKGRNWEG